jgi:F-type H+-transporting ATPase subunit gamma
MARSRQYAAACAAVIGALSSRRECELSPYMRRTEGGAAKLIVIAGDRGLAGGYNANVFRLLRTVEGAEVIPIGKRACDRAGKPPVSSEDFTFAQAKDLADGLCGQFLAGETDRVGVIYTEYVSILTQEARVRWLLPLEKGESPAGGMVFEPDEITVLDEAVPGYVAGMIYAAVRESFASEVAARRMAMDSAGKNAREMIDKLQLRYNRARQTAITQEITEIVAGSGLNE